MPKITPAQLQSTRQYDTPGLVLSPLVTGVNEDGTPFSLDVNSTSPGAAAAAAAKVYFAGTGHISIAAAGNIRATIGNPSTATDNINIVRLAGLASAVGYAQLFIDPTTGLPVGARRVNNTYLIAGPDSTSFLADQSATVPLAGGTDTQDVIGLPAGSRFSIDLSAPLIIPPGHVLGINVPFTGAADIAFSAFWYRG